MILSWWYEFYSVYNGALLENYGKICLPQSLSVSIFHCLEPKFRYRWTGVWDTNFCDRRLIFVFTFDRKVTIVKYRREDIYEYHCCQEDHDLLLLLIFTTVSLLTSFFIHHSRCQKNSYQLTRGRKKGEWVFVFL